MVTTANRLPDDDGVNDRPNHGLLVCLCLCPRAVEAVLADHGSPKKFKQNEELLAAATFGMASTEKRAITVTSTSKPSHDKTKEKEIGNLISDEAPTLPIKRAEEAIDNPIQEPVNSGGDVHAASDEETGFMGSHNKPLFDSTSTISPIISQSDGSSHNRNDSLPGEIEVPVDLQGGDQKIEQHLFSYLEGDSPIQIDHNEEPSTIAGGRSPAIELPTEDLHTQSVHSYDQSITLLHSAPYHDKALIFPNFATQPNHLTKRSQSHNNPAQVDTTVATAHSSFDLPVVETITPTHHQQKLMQGNKTNEAPETSIIRSSKSAESNRRTLAFTLPFWLFLLLAILVLILERPETIIRRFPYRILAAISSVSPKYMQSWLCCPLPPQWDADATYYAPWWALPLEKDCAFAAICGTHLQMAVQIEAEPSPYQRQLIATSRNRGKQFTLQPIQTFEEFDLVFRDVWRYSLLVRDPKTRQFKVRRRRVKNFMDLLSSKRNWRGQTLQAAMTFQQSNWASSIGFVLQRATTTIRNVVCGPLPPGASIHAFNIQEGGILSSAHWWTLRFLKSPKLFSGMCRGRISTSIKLELANNDGTDGAGMKVELGWIDENGTENTKSSYVILLQLQNIRSLHTNWASTVITLRKISGEEEIYPAPWAIRR